jgi:hypothetical protein
MKYTKAQPQANIQSSLQAGLHSYEQIWGHRRLRGSITDKTTQRLDKTQPDARRTSPSSKSNGIQPETNPALCMYLSAYEELSAHLVEFRLAYSNPVNEQRGPHSGEGSSKIRVSITSYPPARATTCSSHHFPPPFPSHLNRGKLGFLDALWSHIGSYHSFRYSDGFRSRSRRAHTTCN